MGLQPFEQHAIDAILDRPSADPDDDAAIAARAAVRLAVVGRNPKPDGWHTYHICSGLMRELVWSGRDATCHWCGQWFRTDVQEGPGLVGQQGLA